MIHPSDLHNNAVAPSDLTDRQQQVAELVASYFTVGRELPSAAWVSRRLNISRQRAQQHLEALRRKGWLDRLR